MSHGLPTPPTQTPQRPAPTFASRVVMTGVAVVAATLVGCGSGETSGNDAASVETAASVDDTSVPTDGEFDYDFYIPEGTQERIDAGEEINVVPAEMEVYVGESIRIVNDDSYDHTVGAFYVPAGGVLEQNFTSPGELSGDCSVHESGRFSIWIYP